MIIFVQKILECTVFVVVIDCYNTLDKIMVQTSLQYEHFRFLWIFEMHTNLKCTVNTVTEAASLCKGLPACLVVRVHATRKRCRI